MNTDHASLPARRARGAPRDRRHAPLPDARPGCRVRHARRGAPARLPRRREIGGRFRAGARRAQPDSTQRVLLYDGEELVGAKQDRILNVTRARRGRRRSCRSPCRASSRAAGDARAAPSTPDAPSRTPTCDGSRRRRSRRSRSSSVSRRRDVWHEVRAQAAAAQRPLGDRAPAGTRSRRTATR